MTILDLTCEQEEYLKNHQLVKKYQKAKELFEQNSFHPSLNVELLEPKHRLIYSLRLDKKYRVIFIYVAKQEVEILTITNHYK